MAVKKKSKMSPEHLAKLRAGMAAYKARKAAELVPKVQEETEVNEYDSEFPVPTSDDKSSSQEVIDYLEVELKKINDKIELLDLIDRQQKENNELLYKLKDEISSNESAAEERWNQLSDAINIICEMGAEVPQEEEAPSEEEDEEADEVRVDIPQKDNHVCKFYTQDKKTKKYLCKECGKE